MKSFIFLFLFILLNTVFCEEIEILLKTGITQKGTVKSLYTTELALENSQFSQPLSINYNVIEKIIYQGKFLDQDISKNTITDFLKINTPVKNLNAPKPMVTAFAKDTAKASEENNKVQTIPEKPHKEILIPEKISISKDTSLNKIFFPDAPTVNLLHYSQKDPFKAFIMGTLLPGGASFYAESYEIGIITAVFQIAGILALTANNSDENAGAGITLLCLGHFADIYNGIVCSNTHRIKVNP